MKSEFTKGEWRVTQETEVFCDDRLIANCGGYFENRNTQVIRRENTANARLIAQAPKLYEACKGMVWANNLGFNGGYYKALMRKAIAEVEGK